MTFSTWDVRRDEYFIDYYIKSHMRSGPYMVGLLAGILVHEHKGSTWKLAKVSFSLYNENHYLFSLHDFCTNVSGLVPASLRDSSLRFHGC